MPTVRIFRRNTFRRSLPLIAAFALLGQSGQAAVNGSAGAGSAGAETRRVGVAGRVLGESNPLPAANIYAYQLADLTLHRVVTDAQGNFLFQDLPAGLYKIIATRRGSCRP